MKVECPNCQKVYKIPKEKLLFGEKFNVKCSACRGRIIIDLRSQTASKKFLDSYETDKKEQPKLSLASKKIKKHDRPAFF
jgi:predicted Zn finger-like uncharacterized protein